MSDRLYGLREVAVVLGMTTEEVKAHVNALWTGLMQDGVQTYLTDEQKLAINERENAE